MDEGQASQTAERVAMRRAAHQLLDRPPVFDDPLALLLLRPEIATRLRDDPGAFEGSPWSRYLRALLAARSRFAEDALHQAIASGVRQYVILGAGFDTFAYRQQYPESALRIFEVDHPATQSVKRERLQQAGVGIPSTLTFVPLDLAHASLASGLVDAAFDSALPAFVSWLGVVPYLTLDQARTTLRAVASLAPGTSIVFDYGVPTESLDERARRVRERIASRVAEMGEPFKTFFDPSDLENELRAAGFGIVNDFDAPVLNERYFLGRSDGLQLGSSSRIAQATVPWR